MRTAKESDFFIELPDVGRFRFGRRTFGDRIAIRANYLRFIGEFDGLDTDLAVFASIAAIYPVLCVECPAGWEVLTDIDMTVPGAEDKIFKLYDMLIDKEDSFRQKPVAGGEGAGEGTP